MEDFNRLVVVTNTPWQIILKNLCSRDSHGSVALWLLGGESHPATEDSQLDTAVPCHLNLFHLSPKQSRGLALTLGLCRRSLRLPHPILDVVVCPL